MLYRARKRLADKLAKESAVTEEVTVLTDEVIENEINDEINEDEVNEDEVNEVNLDDLPWVDLLAKAKEKGVDLKTHKSRKAITEQLLK